MDTIHIILILILVIFYFLQFNKYEKFINDNLNNNIDFYVISLKSLERLQNIDLQNKKLNTNINIIDAVNGLQLNQNELLKLGEISQSFYNEDSKRSKEIGCHKSHFNIYNLINNNLNKKKYSVVLEDDFNVIPENINEKMETLLNNISDLDFDIIFLGNTFPNNSIDKIKDDLYLIDKNKYTIGTFAYLINNKNIDKIINLTKLIDAPIDNKLDTLIKNNSLNAFVVYPNLINYIAESKSNIIN